MQKDYQPVKAELGNEEELARIDAFWTDIWSKMEIDPDSISQNVPLSDEFRVIDPYVRLLPNNAQILDGGCGMGQWVHHLSGRGYQATGVDISSETIERLRRQLPNGDWKTGDINDLSYPDATFDAYLSWGTFEHFEAGLASPVNEAWRLLKPGGYLFTSVPHDSLRMMPGRYFNRWPAATRSAGPDLKFYQWRLTKAELALELGRGGFQVLEIASISKQEGTGRLFRALTGFAPDGPIWGRAVKALSIILPGAAVGHMILAVAQKPAVSHPSSDRK